nr:S24 family peptidase [Paradevosia shaoguanensis]
MRNLDVGEDGGAFTLVPRIGVSASAGYGLAALAEEVTERLAFKTAWLHDMGLSPAYVGLLTCSGDSQDPIIKDGALMLVDMRPNQQIRSGNFYIIVLDGDVLVKKVNRRVDGAVELLSHNPAYPTEVIDSQRLDKLTIPGRVVWAGQKL